MKKILFVITVVIFVGCLRNTNEIVKEEKSIDQHKLDKLVLENINAYRSSLQLHALKWNDSIYVGAKHHTDYEFAANQKEINKAIQSKDIMYVMNSGHDESVKVSGIERESFNTRAKKYHFKGECVMMYSGRMGMDEYAIANWIVEAWKNSPSHNELLISPKYFHGAVSTKVLLIYEFNERDKYLYSKYGGINSLKDIIYFSSTFNCR